MVPLRDKLLSAIVTIFSKLLSTSADSRVTNLHPLSVDSLTTCFVVHSFKASSLFFLKYKFIEFSPLLQDL